LYIQLRFSDNVYVKDNSSVPRPITRSEYLTQLTSAIYLTQKGDTSVKIYASQVRAPNGDPTLMDLSQWEFIFPHGKFEYSVTYELTLGDSILFDKNGMPVTLPTNIHTYAMKDFDISCSGKGVYYPQTKECVCDSTVHRTGVFCERCASGYEENGKGDCLLVDTCTLYTCGCYETNPVCRPIGNCTVNLANPLGKRILCQCPALYTGPRCELCISGYGGYPHCSRACPPCLHGTCNNKTSLCECYPGFSGPICADLQLGIGAKVIGGLLFSAVVVGVVGALIFRFIKKRREEMYIDHSMELELEGGKKFGGGDDDSNEFGLGEEEHQIELSDNADGDNALFDT